MNRKELERIESILKENGYRKVDSPMHCNADYYWWKAFGKDCNHYEEGRSLYQVLLNVYDWVKYWDRDPMLRKLDKCASITVMVSVSRTINEPSISLNFDLNRAEFNLKDIEDKGFEFFKYVNENFSCPPKDE